MILDKLIRAILAKYSLPRHGIHGLPHWARVLENGIRLAPLTGADIHIVELFAVYETGMREYLAESLRSHSLNTGHLRLLFQTYTSDTGMYHLPRSNSSEKSRAKPSNPVLP